MSDLWTELGVWATPDKIFAAGRAVVLLVLGYLLARVVSRVLYRAVQPRLELQKAVLVRRGVFYFLALLFVVAAFHELGFNLGVVLGAAGILSVALGFASQTSASNLISGLFLLGERPFAIGDVIHVGGTTGEVLSIDLLSVKLRTFDNLFVRIPNETLIKSEVRTLTRYPIRRLDLHFEVAYKEDIERVHEILLELADENPMCLDEPKPLFVVQGFEESGVRLQFSPWTTQQNLVELKTSIQTEILERFRREGIDIPFPHCVVLPAGEPDRRA